MLNKHTVRQFLRFGVAGSVGFLVDVTVLYLVMTTGASFYLARVVSFFCAVFTTWQINRNFAFNRPSSMSLWQEWRRYVAVMLGGGLVNYLFSALTVFMLPPGQFVPMLGVAVGAIAGMMLNFINSKLIVFKQ